MRLFVFFILSFLAISAQAEYRMFLLQVTNPDGTAGRQIPSNLDPDQYLGYYHLQAGETLTYIDTWMCKGRTNEMPPCPNPTASSSTGSTPAVLETPAPAPAAPAEPGTNSPP